MDVRSTSSADHLTTLDEFCHELADTGVNKENCKQMLKRLLKALDIEVVLRNVTIWETRDKEEYKVASEFPTFILIIFWMLIKIKTLQEAKESFRTQLKPILEDMTKPSFPSSRSGVLKAIDENDATGIGFVKKVTRIPTAKEESKLLDKYLDFKCKRMKSSNHEQIVACSSLYKWYKRHNIRPKRCTNPFHRCSSLVCLYTLTKNKNHCNNHFNKKSYYDGLDQVYRKKGVVPSVCMALYNNKLQYVIMARCQQCPGYSFFMFAAPSLSNLINQSKKMSFSRFSQTYVTQCYEGSDRTNILKKAGVIRKVNDNAPRRNRQPHHYAETPQQFEDRGKKILEKKEKCAKKKSFYTLSCKCRFWLASTIVPEEFFVQNKVECPECPDKTCDCCVGSTYRRTTSEADKKLEANQESLLGKSYTIFLKNMEKLNSKPMTNPNKGSMSKDEVADEFDFKQVESDLSYGGSGYDLSHQKSVEDIADSTEEYVGEEGLDYKLFFTPEKGHLGKRKLDLTEPVAETHQPYQKKKVYPTDEQLDFSDLTQLAALDPYDFELDFPDSQLAALDPYDFELDFPDSQLAALDPYAFELENILSVDITDPHQVAAEIKLYEELSGLSLLSLRQ